MIPTAVTFPVQPTRLCVVESFPYCTSVGCEVGGRISGNETRAEREGATNIKGTQSNSEGAQGNL